MAIGRPVRGCHGLALAALAACAALLLAMAPWRPALGHDTALLEPRIGQADRAAVLSKADAARYAALFALQEAGRWGAADAGMEKLGDPLLIGHLLAQRYLHPTAYHSSFAELAAWLERYRDHPDAPRIFALARKRMPEGAAPPLAPSPYEFPAEAAQTQALSKPEPLPTKERTEAEAARKAKLDALMEARVDDGWPSGAREILEGEYAPLVGPAEYDLARTVIARGYLSANRDEAAFALSHESAQRSGALVPDAHWLAGLAAWRLGRTEEARDHFAALARSANADAALAAAGAYWAARASLLLRRPEEVNAYLVRAAGEPLGFYGLIARRALGIDSEIFGARSAAASTIATLPGVVRARALMEAGQPARARLELERLLAHAPPKATGELLAMATRLGLPVDELALASKAERDGSQPPLEALFPVPPWEPVDGFTVDPALIYSIIRVESKFDATARGPRGARGVMQLMPQTAAAMARWLKIVGFEKSWLDDPALNMALGQAYIGSLMGEKKIGKNLVALIAAYNVGPLRVAEWLESVPFRDDPLLLIETIPLARTRAYVEEILTGYWIYQARLKRRVPSLDAIASGGWPLYVFGEEPTAQPRYAED